MNALLIINEADYKLQYNQITIGEYEDIVNQLVDVEPVRHGEWEVFSARSFHYIRYICSECGTVYTTVNGYQYCPNCGAKMDEVTE